jgi:hypothetical protein
MSQVKLSNIGSFVNTRIGSSLVFGQVDCYYFSGIHNTTQETAGYCFYILITDSIVNAVVVQILCNNPTSLPAKPSHQKHLFKTLLNIWWWHTENLEIEEFISSKTTAGWEPLGIHSKIDKVSDLHEVTIASNVYSQAEPAFDSFWSVLWTHLCISVCLFCDHTLTLPNCGAPC